MQYMIIETFKCKPEQVYRRVKEKGRLMPDGLSYVSSWVEESFQRCFQIIETDSKALIDVWIDNWIDLVEFEIIPVISSDEARIKSGV